MPAWQITALPGYVIMYQERRDYPSARKIYPRPRTPGVSARRKRDPLTAWPGGHRRAVNLPADALVGCGSATVQGDPGKGTT